jgi:C-terminal processing protease CtpA/Prc
MVINRIKDNGPAVGIGIEPGDRLLAVDGIYLDSLSTPELTKILLGAEGTQVRLEIAKADGRTIQLVLYRGECGLGVHAENSRESVTSSVESVSSDMSSDQEYLMGVGLTFHRPDGLGGVVVKKVKENGVAAADGRIASGDRLLSVDGKSLGGKISNEDLMRMVLGEPGSSVRLQIQYQNGQSEEVDLIRALELQGSDNLDRSSAGRRSQLCSLGVTFFPPTDDHQVVIKRLKEGGAAQVRGKIMAGDRLIEIDGRQVHKLSGSELKALLMGLPGSCCQVRVQHQNGTSEHVNLVRIAKEDGEEQPILVQKKETARAQRSAGPRPQTLSISSEKSLDEISFSAAACKMERKRRVGLGVILSEHDGGEGFLIKKVKAGTASALSGKVFAADRLLSIDGTSLTGLEQSEIEKLVVRPAGSTSVCVLRRKDGSLDHVMLCRPEQSLQSEECATAVSEDEDEDHLSDEPERPVGLGMVFLRPDGKGGRIVKRKKEGSAADAHNNILPGDRCLTIDGQAIENLTDRELSDLNRGMIGSTAIVVLRSKSGMDKECVLKRCKPIFENIVEGCGSELSYDSSIASGLTSSDTSGRSGLGLTFHEWAAGTGGLRVKRVKKGGAADNSAQIHPGDVIQKIDGMPLDNIESRALLKLLMGPEGSIVVVNLINGQGIAMQVILTRAPRGGHAEYEQESSLSPSKDEDMSASKQVSVVRSPPEVAMSPKVLATTPVSPPSFVADKSSPPSQTPKSWSPKVLTAKPVPSPPTFPTAQSPPSPLTLVTASPMLSPPAISTRQSSPPSQMPKVIAV